MSQRRQSRELAVKVLYQMEHGEEASPQGAERALRDFAANFSAPDHIFGYTQELIRGIHEHLPELDQALNAVSRRWKVGRMSHVDRNILRLAAWEMLHAQGVPPKVAINEAVELAKRYGTDESPGFVNAILDALRAARSLD